ncbi:MAG TPA: ABC transporter ATP-binding protein [Acidimicrobiales bacterium]|nr:ABC transporter ATP-binding protein [Acidimicrobiales bacterium]
MIEAVDVHKAYERGGAAVHALRGASLEVGAGEFCSIMGPSGSGKSTLLHLLGGLDHATGGVVRIDGVDLAELSDDELTQFRRRKLGFVFQFFNLLPSMSAWENAALPLMLDGQRLGKLRPRAVELLERVGLGDRVDHRPAQLSGGQLQRVALARALIADPVVLLADEPTGNLDSESGRAVLQLLRSCADGGLTVVMVTHDANAAAVGHRIVQLRDGLVNAAASTAPSVQ